MDLLDLPTYLPNTKPEDDVAPKSAHPTAKVEDHTHTDPTHTDSDEESSLTIQGTNIVLKTDEDIQKWIADRKRNWPSKKNIERKDVVQKPCKFGKNCKYGKKCKNLHDNFKVINNLKIAVPNKYENHTKSNSLFKMLVKNDQLAENTKFLEFLKYLDGKNLIDHNFG